MDWTRPTVIISIIGQIDVDLKNFTRFIPIVLTVGLLLSACADEETVSPGSESSGTTLTTGSPTAPAAPVYAGPIATAEKIDNDAIVLMPPTNPKSAVISPLSAYLVCSNGTGVCGNNSAASISLATVTTLKAGEPGENGTIIPLINNALVYVLRWKGEPCSPAGVTPGAPSAPPRTYACGIVDFVDAVSGRSLYALEGPTV